MKDDLIFWEEADQTWEPADNLAGSEQLIKEFEASEEVSDDDVKLCDECQRIFVSDASLQSCPLSSWCVEDYVEVFRL